jgi:hypothetical protein
MMHGREETDSVVLAKKPMNNCAGDSGPTTGD